MPPDKDDYFERAGERAGNYIQEMHERNMRSGRIQIWIVSIAMSILLVATVFQTILILRSPPAPAIRPVTAPTSESGDSP